MPPLNKSAYKPGAQSAFNPFSNPNGNDKSVQPQLAQKPFQQPASKPVMPAVQPVAVKPNPQPTFKPAVPPPAQPAKTGSASKPGSRLESWAFRVLLAVLVLSPLSFWSSAYVTLDTVKTAVIAIGILASAVIFGIAAFKEKKLVLPPRSMTWLGVLMAASLIASAFVSGHAWKSIFGQGFEISSASFVILLFLSAALVGAAVFRKAERAIILYAALAGPFIILWIFQALRLVFGAHFASLGILNVVTATVFGNWYSLAIYSLVVIILGLSAVMFLPLSRRVKIAYWVLIGLAAVGAFIINSAVVWDMAALVLLGLAIYATAIKPSPAGPRLVSFLKRVAWIPFAAFLVAGLFAWKGNQIAGPIITKMNAGYSELSLPWQMTLDVGTGALKDQPLFGTGPNRFTQAFLAHKPAGIDQTDAWSVEFNTGFGLIPTFMIEQGMIGLILWILLFVYLGLLGKKSLARAAAASDPTARFIVVSSFFAAVFVWLVSLAYVPSQAAFLLAFAMTGIWLGSSMSYGYLSPLALPTSGRSSRIFRGTVVVLSAVAAIWGIVAIKDTAALAYFGKGLQALTVANDPIVADNDFRMAVTLNPIDVYWQARAEASLAEARALVGTLTASSDASTSQAVATRTVALGNQASQYAANAVAADPTNYYNHVSEARVAELAASLKMQNGYQAGVQAYSNAIRFNPGNPSLYLSLARLQVSANQLDAALQTIGASLQVKNNYLDAVFLLTQVEAAKGNLPDAITAAKFAIGLNDSNPLLYFQLGLLQYMSGDYAGAAPTLAQAVKLQPDYANAEYFLGLSYARLNRLPDAAAQFQALAVTNPDNQEVALILANLRAGKSPFVGATPPASTAPEKRSSPPIPEKKP